MVGEAVFAFSRSESGFARSNRRRFSFGQRAAMDTLFDPLVLIVLSMIHSLGRGEDGEHREDEEKSFQILHGEGRDGGTGGEFSGPGS